MVMMMMMMMMLMMMCTDWLRNDDSLWLRCPSVNHASGNRWCCIHYISEFCAPHGLWVCNASWFICWYI